MTASSAPDHATPATEFTPGLSVRGVTPPLKLADFKLIAFDMDSTLINIECVDEIADAAGRKAEVAAITEAAMRGEITDYKESLRQRVALLKGVTVASMERVYAERLQLNPGAAELVAACQAAGLNTLLVSGGFTFFTDRIRDRLRLDFTAPPADRPGLGDRYRVFVRITVWQGDDLVLVPQAALFRSGGGWAVFRAVDGLARLTPVTVGPQAEGQAEVVSGLEPGERVVLYPPTALAPGARVVQRPE